MFCRVFVFDRVFDGVAGRVFDGVAGRVFDGVAGRVVAGVQLASVVGVPLCGVTPRLIHAVQLASVVDVPLCGVTPRLDGLDENPSGGCGGARARQILAMAFGILSLESVVLGFLWYIRGLSQSSVRGSPTCSVETNGPGSTFCLPLYAAEPTCGVSSAARDDQSQC